LYLVGTRVEVENLLFFQSLQFTAFVTIGTPIVPEQRDEARSEGEPVATRDMTKRTTRTFSCGRILCLPDTLCTSPTVEEAKRDCLSSLVIGREPSKRACLKVLVIGAGLVTERCPAPWIAVMPTVQLLVRQSLSNSLVIGREPLNWACLSLLVSDAVLVTPWIAVMKSPLRGSWSSVDAVTVGLRRLALAP
jgi:hypothetical protein